MNTLFRSLKDAFLLLIGNKWVFGSLGSVVAMLLFGKNLFGISVCESVRYSVYFLLSGYVLCYIYSTWNNYKIWFAANYFDNIWGEGIILITEVEDVVSKVLQGAESKDKALKRICNSIKRYYDKKNKSICSVSIKVPTDVGASVENMIVVNVARDDNSAMSRNTDAYRNKTHCVFSNSAYLTIFTRLRSRKSKAYYLNNDIQHDANYETTSNDVYEDGVLPYASELVFPIKSFPNDQYNGATDISGFLCVDCKSVNKFQDDKYSVALMKTIAHSICQILK